LGHELATDIRGTRLNSKEAELADKERWLAERLLEELATTH
jgi:hypothetical protein